MKPLKVLFVLVRIGVLGAVGFALYRRVFFQPAHQEAGRRPIRNVEPTVPPSASKTEPASAPAPEPEPKVAPAKVDDAEMTPAIDETVPALTGDVERADHPAPSPTDDEQADTSAMGAP